MNFNVVTIYKHGGKRIFRFWDHLNPPHLRWSFRFFGDFRPFQRNFYIFINAGLEPKLFEIKSSTQQQSCKAHKIGQFCHQDQPYICLCLKVREGTMSPFQLAPKWYIEGSQWRILHILVFSTLPNPPTTRLESPILGYHTRLHENCLYFHIESWWSKALWSARTTRRRRPERLLT